VIARIWSRLGVEPRVGVRGCWKPFEDFNDTHQHDVLRAAAEVMGLVEDGVVDGMGPMAGLFRHPTVSGKDWPGGASLPRQHHHTPTTMELMEDVIREARVDPIAATQFRNLALWGRSNPKAVVETDLLMAQLGILNFADADVI
jgi:hypothetical protein